MPINSAVLALVLIFIPGILCYGIIAALASKQQRDSTIIFLQIFMYGVSSYMVLTIFIRVWPQQMAPLGLRLGSIALLYPASIEKFGIDPIPIVWASLAGLAQGLIVTINVNNNLLMRLCRYLRITKRFSDPDVWSFLLNSDDTDNWVTVRHTDRGHIYQGYVRAFSSGNSGEAKDRELVLSNVRVYDLATAEPVGEIPILYLAFKEDNLVLEFGAKPAPAGTESGQQVQNGATADSP